jgi:4-amino-4-deoxy-L-arabinose transferase-like glycosyltransferase
MQFISVEIGANALYCSVRGLLRRNARFFLGATLAGLGLRLFFVFRFPAIVDDSRLYADIAKNWLHYGIYGVTDSGQVAPTLSRLPGYPGYLAAVFALFGVDNFRAVLLIQVLFDIGTCFLVADLARRLQSDRAAKAAFALAALCPFLANYAAAALTETLEVFFTALALNLAVQGIQILNPHANPKALQPNSSGLRAGSVVGSATFIWLGCGLSIGAAILLRPDGGIVLAVVEGYLLLLLIRRARARLKTESVLSASLPILRAGIIVAVSATALLIPWTLRNLHTLHRFEPLAPRYANDSDEPAMPGFNRWVKTWMADYVSVQEIYWSVPGEAIDMAKLPRRAFDSEKQQQETAALFADYDQDHDMTPALDARFAALAAERIHASPLRYYIWLPAVRIADMWLRPRTELLPPDPRWWEFNDDPLPLAVAIGFGVVNVLYVGMAVAGIWYARTVPGIGVLLLFLIVRSLFLGTLENPETRYTLEGYPVVMAFAATLFRGKRDASASKHGTSYVKT